MENKIANITLEALKEIKKIEEKMNIVIVAYEKKDDKKGS